MTLEEAIKRYTSDSFYEKSDGNLQGYLEFNQLAEWLKELKQLREQERWIPVSERLPEQFKEVIVTDIETSDTYLSRYVGNGYWECDNGLFKNRIIAWMPLPEPYKAESEIHCNCTDEEIAKSFISNVEAVKDLLPRVESEDK